ncbi:MAG: TA system VapC family ribonuclease toxin [Wenzhouxiangella sp.]
MIVPDVNLLVYAVNEDSPHHQRSRDWLEQTLSGSETVGLPWLVLVAFLRLTTHPRIFQYPLETATALDVIGTWLAQPCTRPLEPGERHWLILSQLLRQSGTAGNLTNDAHLAAIAIAHNACLHSADNDFRRFPELKHHNPLADSMLQEPAGPY